MEARVEVVDPATGEVKFELDMPENGRVGKNVLADLVRERNIAKDHAQAFADAVKRVAEKHRVKPVALKRYVVAIADDKVAALNKETDDLELLLGLSADD